MKIPAGYRRDPYRTAATAARIEQIKDVAEEDARKIRLIWTAYNFDAIRLVYPEAGILCTEAQLRTTLQRECIDRILRTSGAEYLGDMRASGNPVYYCNAGDTYATTVLFWGHHMRVGCIGDLIEHNRVTQPPQL